MSSITINILRYNIFPGEPAHSMYSIYNMKTHRRLNEDMELHFLEVPKFQKKPVSEMTSVERWLAYFSNKLNINEMEELAMNEAAIQTALDAAAVFMQNKKERLDYLNREMAIMDYESDKDAWIEEGKAEGRAEGMEEGLAKGMAEGEKAADRRTAMRMLQKNKPIDEILELVDLTRAEIEELARDMKKI